MKLVGKVIRNYSLTRLETMVETKREPGIKDCMVTGIDDIDVVDNGDSSILPISCIGIAPWGAITNRKVLNDAKGECVQYEFEKEPSASSGEVVYLDPNHTHQLLVDDGSEDKFGREIEFRTKLEAFLTESMQSLIVTIIIEGGPLSLETAYQGMKNKTPCVVMNGTGRAADVLAEAYKMYDDLKTQLRQEARNDSATGSRFSTIHDSKIFETFENCPITKAKLEKSLKNHLSLNKEKIAVSMKHLFECIKHSEYLHIYEVSEDDDIQTTTLAQVIVDAFLDTATKDDFGNEIDGLWRRLQLAHQWNHKDAAKSVIEDAASRNVKFEANKCYLLLVDALKAKQIEFFDLYLDRLVPLNGIDDKRLRDLFEIVKGHSLDDKLNELIGSIWSIKSLYKVQKYYPYNYLFVWAVNTNDMNLAFHLLKKVKYPIACALIACNILQTRGTREKNLHDFHNLEMQKKEFEDIAYDLLSECCALSTIRTQFLLLQEIVSLGSTSVLELALQSNCLKFVSHRSCQDVLHRMWRNGIGSSNVPLASVVPLLAPFLVTFDAQGTRDVSTSDFHFLRDPAMLDERGMALRKEISSLKSIGIDVGLRHNMSYKDKLSAFFEAPCIKFGYNIISNFVLLFIFSILILNESEYFESERLHWEESIVILFWISFILQEIQQVVANGKHLRSHLSDKWNILDSLIIIMIVLSLFLRVIAIYDKTESIMDLIVKMFYCFIYMLFCVRLLHVFIVTSLLGPKIVMIQMMLKDLLSIGFCFIILGFCYSFVSYTLEASMAHLCCSGRAVGNFSSSIALFVDIFGDSWWNLFGEVGEFSKFDNQVKEQFFLEFSQKILLPGMKAIYMMLASIILLNLLIAMFSYSFTNIQDHSYQIWCTNRHDLILEYYNRSKLPAPLSILSVFQGIFVFACRNQKRKISTKRTIKVKLELMKEQGSWSDDGKWSSKFAKVLRRWEVIVANKFWLGHKALDRRARDI